MRSITKAASVAICIVLIALSGIAQEKPPAPGAPRPAKIPRIIETRLPNGLRVVTVERHSSPLVAARLMIGVGTTAEKLQSSGLANMTSDLITKGTKTRNATQIAEDLEFLGADLNTTVGLDTTNLSLTVTSDKLAQALAVMADVSLRPTFPQAELDLLKSQKLDELTASLKSPGFLTTYVASVYAFGGNPAGGTPESLKEMNRAQVSAFYNDYYDPDRSTLIFVGDITPAKALSLARANFGTWRSKGLPAGEPEGEISVANEGATGVRPLVTGILVVDLPNAGQASVAYVKALAGVGRIKAEGGSPEGPEKDHHNEISDDYIPGVVANSVLGGGYSARLNQEIRIKRGLSYGAGSSISWRRLSSRFSTRVQTKNESAAEVAELVADEVRRLGKDKAATTELAARKAALIGEFGLRLETDADLLGLISDLYAYGLDAEELEGYGNDVQRVDAAKAAQFASEHLPGGSIVIAGDYAKFKVDLAKRFHDTPITVIAADKIDLSKPNLQK
ncbi:MAG TPA: pitrilysin family protein [Pyrinomonadaceae bacterium]|nr:pitrilysin family protein [Pyrinomonadaceae bacterium]